MLCEFRCAAKGISGVRTHIHSFLLDSFPIFSFSYCHEFGKKVFSLKVHSENTQIKIICELSQFY